jgi:hypothetical protein
VIDVRSSPVLPQIPSVPDPIDPQFPDPVPRLDKPSED